MSGLYSIPYERKPSSNHNDFSNSITEFNNAVKIKTKYINSAIERDLSGKASLSDLFSHLFPKLSKSEFEHYLNKADGSSKQYNLARVLVLQNSGASEWLISQAIENENKYSIIYTLIKNGINENEINNLFLRHDSPHDIHINKLYQDLDFLLQEKEILQNLKKQNTNNSLLTEASLSKRDVSTLYPPFSEKTVSSLSNKEKVESQKIESSNQKNNIDTTEKNSKIARTVDDYGISKKLARLTYNNKIVFHKSILVLNKLMTSGVGYGSLKKIVRGSFDSSMFHYSKSITDFYLEQYNYNVSIEGSKVSDILTGSLIIDFNYVLSGKPRELRKEIIEIISIKKNEVAFSAVELITLINSGVSNKLLYSVAKGEVTASDAYLIHVFKVRKSEIEAICNKLGNKELSSEGIFAYARGVYQGGDTQPDINNELASRVQETLSGKAELEVEISEANIGINMLENKSASDIEKSQIDEDLSKAFVLHLNLSKKTNDVIFDKINYQSLFQNERLKSHGKIINFLSPDPKYGLIDISNLVILFGNKASGDLLKKVANRDVLFQQAYVETQSGVIDTNIVEQRIKRENGEITVQQFIDSGTVMTSSQKGCQENQTFDECLAMYKEQVAKTADEAEAKLKSMADNINSKAALSPREDILSEGDFSPLTSLMSSVLENSEMLCSYYSPTNSNAWASLGDMLAVS
ncbi:TPA: hypothetical protein PXM28_002816 [Yersinia enterocolitica]|nr:hypothetical protein [Yersinia enterocolitica]